MGRDEDVNVGKRLGDAPDGSEDVGHRLAPALPPVRGHEHDALPADHRLADGAALFELVGHLANVQQCVDDGVAGDGDVAVGHALADQVRGRCRGRREVPAGQPRRQAAVHFFRIGAVDIARAQSGLDVADRHLVVERRERGREGGGGVALHEHCVRTDPLHQRSEPRQRPDGDVGQGLARLHDVEVVVGRDLEDLEDLVEHLAMLRGHGDDGLEAVPLGEFRHDRRHLDRLGPRSKRHEHASRHVLPLSLASA